jgi:DNA-binding MarR family transcriptional regulator
MSVLVSLGCTCGRLRMLARRLTRIYDAQLACEGIKVTQYSLLVNISRGEKTLSELAAAMDMERTTLTRNLEPLETQGWVKTRSGRDPRSRVVAISDSGRRKIETVLPLWRKAQREVAATLGESHLGALHQEVDRALDALPAETPQGTRT